MKYSDFIENLVDDLQVEFEERGKKIKVEIEEVDKPWGKEVGLSFNDGSYTSPIIYPKDQYEYHEAGMNYILMLNALVDEVERALDAKPVEIEFDSLTLKETITMQLINTERSLNYLLDKPHRNVEDLSIIYRLNINLGDGSNGSSVVTNGVMELMGMNEQELYELAMERAPLNRTCMIKNIVDMFENIESEEVEEIPKVPLVVVTNEEQCYGAASILYPGIFETCSEIMDGDFFILPSSQHEVLIFSDNGDQELHAIKAIVSEVNDSLVEPKEFLSNNVYRYDSKEKIFEIADKYVKRMKEKHSVIDSLKEKRTEIDKSEHLRRCQDVGSRKGQGLIH